MLVELSPSPMREVFSCRSVSESDYTLLGMACIHSNDCIVFHEVWRTTGVERKESQDDGASGEDERKKVAELQPMVCHD